MALKQEISIPRQLEAAQKHGLLPPEAIEGMRSVFLSLFGSVAKLDCWLTRMAEELANTASPAIRTISLDATVIPAAFQTWMHRPREVVDLLLERMHDFSIWGYTVKIRHGGESYEVRVIDQANGHVIEVVDGSDSDILMQLLKEKYGPNIEVVKE